MPTIAHANVPTPKSWDEFEDIILSAAKLRWSSTNFFRHGRTGQEQHGVDVYGNDAEGQQIGVQGKNTVMGLSQAIVNKEVAKAESFKPPLAALYIATTARRDANIQEFSRILSYERRKDGKFPVLILFWEDIVQDLSLNESEFFKHYPQLRSSAPIDQTKELTANSLSHIFREIHGTQEKCSSSQKTKSTKNRGSYWNESDALAKTEYSVTKRVLFRKYARKERIELTTNGCHLFYVRLVPGNLHRAPFENNYLLDAVNNERIGVIGRDHDECHIDINKFGPISYETEEFEGRPYLLSFTQLFRNGEMWSITRRFHKTTYHPENDFDSDYIDVDLLRRQLQQYLPPIVEGFLKINSFDKMYNFEIGGVGLKGYQLYQSAKDALLPREINHSEIFIELQSLETAEAVMGNPIDQFLRHLFDEVGERDT